MKPFVPLLKIISILLAIFTCISCSNANKQDNIEQIQHVWPSPPAQPRYQYITTLFSSADIEVKARSDRFRELVTGQDRPNFRFKRPLDIAAFDGKLYVLDSSSPTVHVFDLRRRKYFKFGYRFEGKLVRPVSISVDGNGRVYVADRGRNSIIIYDGMGLFQKHIPLNDIATQIAGITTDSMGRFIYAVDRGGIDSDSHQVLKIDSNGQLVKRIGRRGKNQTEFNLPIDISLSDDNYLYVLDAGNFRVQVIDTNGHHIKSWGRAGNGLGLFGMPRSIAIDNENNIYISDAQFGNVQIFSSNGDLLMHLGKLSNMQGPGNYTLITGITLDRKGHLYILDQYLNKLDVFKKLTTQERTRLQQLKQTNQ